MRYQELHALAQRVAIDHPEFFEIKGPGKGDKCTERFMAKLRSEAARLFGADFAEAGICGDGIASKVDFYFADEGSVVEIALTLKNASNEYEKDFFKVLLAKAAGARIERLVFISKPGAIKRRAEPLPRAIAKWVKLHHGIDTIILELTPQRPTA